MMADYSDDPRPEGPAKTAGTILNVAGALVSLGLLVGIGYWGYNLIMRDVTGIPVVRAMEGPMRRAPDNPGGEVALHTGLSVNEVAAEGGAAGPEDVLVLAPSTDTLTEEDLLVQPTAEAEEDPASVAVLPEPAPEVIAQPVPEPIVVEPPADDITTGPEVAPSDGPLTPEQILALAEQIATGVAPLTDLAEGVTAPAETAINGVPSEVIADIIPASVPGVSSSLRPVLRPERLAEGAAQAAPPAVVEDLDTIDPALLISTEDVPVGTSLAQLGAFDSPAIAAQEWRRLNGRFTDFMAGKTRLIQEAERGGRTFYRLRASGFADLADARRFCAALMAENADCVPVAVR
jgi:hypothetical protein